VKRFGSGHNLIKVLS